MPYRASDSAPLDLDAHRAFAHRIFAGWDIAPTTEGSVLLEGRLNLDVMFPQRVHRQGFAQKALGPLLQHHLATLHVCMTWTD